MAIDGEPFILFLFAEQEDLTHSSRSHPPSLTDSHKHMRKKKEGLDTFMQIAQCTARDGAKSHNEKQKQREVNE